MKTKCSQCGIVSNVHVRESRVGKLCGLPVGNGNHCGGTHRFFEEAQAIPALKISPEEIVRVLCWKSHNETNEHTKRIGARYNELKRTHDFQSSEFMAKVEWLREQLSLPPEEKSAVVPPERGFVYLRVADGKKFCVNYDVLLNTIAAAPDAWQFVCRTPHADEDFSYCCNNGHCRCMD